LTCDFAEVFREKKFEVGILLCWRVFSKTDAESAEKGAEDAEKGRGEKRDEDE
jgi:hypothetical protein